MRRGGYYDPAHFDLLQVSSVTNSFKQMMLYNNILRYNPIDAGKTIIPDLATSWEVSEDGKTWTFPIREEVNFHDGTILTAEDVAASWSRVIDPPAGVVSARQGLYSPFGPSIEVIDPLTVAFNFETPPPLKYGLNAFALEWHGVFPKSFLERARLRPEGCWAKRPQHRRFPISGTSAGRGLEERKIPRLLERRTSFPGRSLDVPVGEQH